MTAIAALTCDNESGPGGVGSTSRGLTHLSDLGGRGLGVSLPSEEQWRPVLGYEGYYEVSDLGNVRSIDRLVRIRNHYNRVAGRPMSTWAEHDGRRAITLTRDGKKKNFDVNVLVLEAFVGPRPEGLVCCHNDGNASNNAVVNLRWDTHSGNCRDTLQHGLHNMARKTHCRHNHPYSGDNLVIDNDGRRGCRTCRRNRDSGRSVKRAPRVDCPYCPQQLRRDTLRRHVRSLHGTAALASPAPAPQGEEAGR